MAGQSYIAGAIQARLGLFGRSWLFILSNCAPGAYRGITPGAYGSRLSGLSQYALLTVWTANNDPAGGWFYFDLDFWVVWHGKSNYLAGHWFILSLV